MARLTICIPRLENFSKANPQMIAIGINPIRYPPVGPKSFAKPELKPEKTGSPAIPIRR